MTVLKADRSVTKDSQTSEKPSKNKAGAILTMIVHVYGFWLFSQR